MPIIGRMTSSPTTEHDWATRPWGRAARITIVAGGVGAATLLLLIAAMTETGSWALVVTGVALAATSARAAKSPSIIRLGVVGANLMVIPLLGFLI